MAILRSRTTTANKALTQYKDDLDAGSGPGTAKIYSGTMPATPDNAATGTRLAELYVSTDIASSGATSILHSGTISPAITLPAGVAGIIPQLTTATEISES